MNWLRQNSWDNALVQKRVCSCRFCDFSSFHHEFWQADWGAKLQGRIVVTVFPRSWVVGAIVNKSDLHAATLSLHHQVNTLRNAHLQMTSCRVSLHFRYSSCCHRLVLRTIGPGNDIPAVAATVELNREAMQRVPLHVVFANCTCAMFDGKKGQNHIKHVSFDPCVLIASSAN